MEKSDCCKEAYREACSDILDLLSNLHQKTNDDYVHRLIDETWNKVRYLEHQKAPKVSPFDEPTVPAREISSLKMP